MNEHVGEEDQYVIRIGMTILKGSEKNWFSCQVNIDRPKGILLVKDSKMISENIFVGSVWEMWKFLSRRKMWESIINRYNKIGKM